MKISRKFLPIMAVPVLALANGCNSVRRLYAKDTSMARMLHSSRCEFGYGLSQGLTGFYRTDDPNRKVVGLIKDAHPICIDYYSTDKRRFLRTLLLGNPVCPRGFESKIPTIEELEELEEVYAPEIRAIEREIEKRNEEFSNSRRVRN